MLTLDLLCRMAVTAMCTYSVPTNLCETSCEMVTCGALARKICALRQAKRPPTPIAMTVAAACAMADPSFSLSVMDAGTARSEPPDGELIGLGALRR